MPTRHDATDLEPVFRFVSENRLTGTFWFADGNVRHFHNGLPAPSDAAGDAPATYQLIREFRRNAGMTQQEFSKEFSIPLGTLRRWEQDRNVPRASSQFLNLLRRIETRQMKV